jgi:hypothetical protein
MRLRLSSCRALDRAWKPGRGERGAARSAWLSALDAALSEDGLRRLDAAGATTLGFLAIPVLRESLSARERASALARALGRFGGGHDIA